MSEGDATDAPIGRGALVAWAVLQSLLFVAPATLFLPSLRASDVRPPSHWVAALVFGLVAGLTLPRRTADALAGTSRTRLAARGALAGAVGTVPGVAVVVAAALVRGGAWVDGPVVRDLLVYPAVVYALTWTVCARQRLVRPRGWLGGVALVAWSWVAVRWGLIAGVLIVAAGPGALWLLVGVGSWFGGGVLGILRFLVDPL